MKNIFSKTLRSANFLPIRNKLLQRKWHHISLAPVRRRAPPARLAQWCSPTLPMRSHMLLERDEREWIRIMTKTKKSKRLEVINRVMTNNPFRSFSAIVRWPIFPKYYRAGRLHPPGSKVVGCEKILLPPFLIIYLIMCRIRFILS